MILQFNLNSLIRSLLPNNWSGPTVDLISVIVHLILVTLIFLIAKRFIQLNFVEKLTKKIRTKKNINYQRSKTINNIFSNLSIYILYFIYFYIVLGLLGFPVETLIAGAGIAGVAIGLGAQDLITDMINGFFIVFENQFVVGDLIEIPSESITGTVEEVGIRTTLVKAASGDLYYVPNSLITVINNKTRHNRQILIEIPYLDENNITDFEKAIQLATEEIYQEYPEIIVEQPNIVGFRPGPMQSFIYRIAFIVSKGEDYRHTSIFYGEYLKKLQIKGLKIPASVYDGASL